MAIDRRDEGAGLQSGLAEDVEQQRHHITGVDEGHGLVFVVYHQVGLLFFDPADLGPDAVGAIFRA